MYDIDIVDGAMLWKLAWTNVDKHSNTVRLIRYNSHIYYVTHINTVFKAYRFTSYDQFFEEAANIERISETSKERVRQIFPESKLHETLFDKMNSFRIPYTDNQNFLNDIAIFDFESICVEGEKFKDSEKSS